MCRIRFPITAVLTVLLLQPSTAWLAEPIAEGGGEGSTDTATASSSDNDESIASNSFELSLAVGVGRFESPIVHSSDYDFYALPQLAWYGERAFFENGLFGYALQERAQEQWDWVLYPNSDGLFFNLSGGEVVTLVATPNPFPVPDRIEVRGQPERDISAMAGLRYSRQHETLYWNLQLGADVSSVHNGWELAAQLGCTRCLTLGPVRFDAELGLTLKSAELVEYYYMPKHGEILPIEGDYYISNGRTYIVGPYHGHHGWLAYAQLQASWPFHRQWAVIASYRDYFLSSALSDTPLLTRDHFAAYFGGLQYRF